MIYFIQAGEQGPIKIGVTGESTAESRRRALQTGNAVALRLIGVTSGGVAEELAMHDRFSDCRIRGEWFHPTQSLVSFIEDAILPWEEEAKEIIRAWDTGQHMTQIAKRFNRTDAEVYRCVVAREFHGLGHRKHLPPCNPYCDPAICAPTK